MKIEKKKASWSYQNNFIVKVTFDHVSLHREDKEYTFKDEHKLSMFLTTLHDCITANTNDWDVLRAVAGFTYWFSDFGWSSNGNCNSIPAYYVSHIVDWFDSNGSWYSVTYCFNDGETERLREKNRKLDLTCDEDFEDECNNEL